MTKKEYLSGSLDISIYEKILEELEELDCIRVYDEAKKSKEKPISFNQVIKQIVRRRN